MTMTSRRLIAALLTAALAPACALNAGTGALAGVAADAERADTDASLTYVGIASAIDAYEAGPRGSGAGTQAAEALRQLAWEALSGVHRAYAAGEPIDLVPLQALARQAASLETRP